MNGQPMAALRSRVLGAYSSMAADPGGEHPFPRGRGFLEELGYPAALLAGVPDEAADAFTGVLPVPVRAVLPAGARVLDLGCGAGVDTLIAARRVGPGGSVVGVDFSGPMLARARRAALTAGAGNVRFVRAAGELLPLADASIDVGLVNGLFNLNPSRAALFRELARVVRPGGRVHAGELILRGPLPPDAALGEEDWFT